MRLASFFFFLCNGIVTSGWANGRSASEMATAENGVLLDAGAAGQLTFHQVFSNLGPADHAEYSVRGRFTDNTWKYFHDGLREQFPAYTTRAIVGKMERSHTVCKLKVRRFPSREPARSVPIGAGYSGDPDSYTTLRDSTFIGGQHTIEDIDWYIDPRRDPGYPRRRQHHLFLRFSVEENSKGLIHCYKFSNEPSPFTLGEVRRAFGDWGFGASPPTHHVFGIRIASKRKVYARFLAEPAH